MGPGVIAVIILIGLGGFFVTEQEPSPLYAGFLHDVGLSDDGPRLTMTSEELKTDLKKFASIIEVKDGVYMIPKPHEAPKGEWCLPFDNTIKIEHPGSYTYEEMSNEEIVLWADGEMDGYAFGNARNDDDMMNFSVIDFNGDIRYGYYDARTCNWTAMTNTKVIEID